MKHDLSDISGKKFGRILVVKDTGKRYLNGGRKYLCLCDCGRKKIIRSDSLKSGLVISCGCYNSEATTKRFKKHGQNSSTHTTPEYHSWHGMMQRCTNPTSTAYNGYGARGIKVCKRWYSFENFFADMGKKPSPKHSLDRFPNNETGNYKLGNCRWGTDEQQSRNKRTNVWIEYGSKKMILADWAKYLHTHGSTIAIKRKRGESYEQIFQYYIHKNHISIK